ncbi:MAG TPA: amidohydrolase family protein, partial [Longimicrobiales bacterium]|nr:amidohydrolase family protein [Longimicrobiales bacterium]
MSSLLIQNALLEGAPAWVQVRDGVIRAVARHAPHDGGPIADRTLDATGLHLFPSLKNGHTHAAMTLFRGWGDDLPLMEWLETRIWPAEARMTEAHVYHGTRLALLEMIRSGTTFLNDMYWHSAAVGRAVDEMGMRACLGSVFIDLGSEATGRKWRASVEAELESLGDLPARVTRSIAPHAIYTVAPDNLRWLGERAREHRLLLHIHLSETRAEVEACLGRHGVRPARLLDRLGLVGDNLVAAHGCWLDREELALLGAAGATVVHNPTANLKLATGGILDYPEARSAGVRVILGTDGAGSNNNLDLLEE